MKIRIRLFAALREAVGRTEMELEVASGATAEDAWQTLVAGTPTLAGRRKGLAASVNRRYAPFDSPLADGDEVVFIPPVSGG
jgi:molybdopterin converting factor subunit 1